MEVKKLSNEVAVSPQISVADLAGIKALGYTLVVCNRPDGESAEQTNFDEIEGAAAELGLKAIYQPVVSGNINDDDVAAFKIILEEAEGPVFAYCRTGTRCTILWCLAKSDELSVDEILSASNAAGYDMSDIVLKKDNATHTL